MAKGKLGDLTVNVGADAGELEEGLAKAGKSLSLFGEMSARQMAAFRRQGAIRALALPMASAIGGVFKEAMTGPVSATTVLGGVQGVLSAIPHPAAQAAGAVAGALGGAVSALSVHYDQLKGNVEDAFGAMVSGAASADQAISKVRIQTLTQGFKEAAKHLSGGGLRGFLDNAAMDIGRAATGPLLGAEGNTALAVADTIRRTEQAAETMRQLQASPAMQQALRRMARERVDPQMADMAQAGRIEAHVGGEQAAAVARGSNLAQAADEAAMLRMEMQLTAQIRERGQSWGQAAEEARRIMAGRREELQAAQAAQRQAVASMEGAQAIQAGREEMELSRQRVQYLSEARGITADMSAEYAQLVRLQEQGASAEVVNARRNQLEQVRAQRVREEAIRQGAQLRVQTRNPLEVLQEEMARLDQMAAAGVDEQTIARGRAAAIAAAERGVGEAPVGQAALMEGSAAAASAILRAQRQAERENPMARLERLNRELADQARETNANTRRLVDELRRGDYFRRADI